MNGRLMVFPTLRLPKYLPMGKKDHVSETPATALLKQHKVAFTEHPYEYLEHGGAQHSAEVLGFDPFTVVKTLVMQDQDAKPLLVLMHGNRKVSTKNLARQIGAKSVEPCKPEVANRHSGYLVGGTSPFGTRRDMPVYVEKPCWPAAHPHQRWAAGLPGGAGPPSVRAGAGRQKGAVRAGRIGTLAGDAVAKPNFTFRPICCPRFGLPAGLVVVRGHRQPRHGPE
jgi:Cys-tRNA(Pro) deacylase